LIVPEREVTKVFFESKQLFNVSQSDVESPCSVIGVDQFRKNVVATYYENTMIFDMAHVDLINDKVTKSLTYKLTIVTDTYEIKKIWYCRE
jgi:hypothetical protein